MSKAFTSNDSEEEENTLARAPVLPPGTRNYITPAGAARLEAERERLIAEKTSLQEGVENKQHRKTIDRNLEFLTERLNQAQIIDPKGQPKDRVLFGAVVTVRDAAGKVQLWRVVGVDETDLDKGFISWISPLARALLDKKIGDVASIGDQRWTILKIE